MICKESTCTGCKQDCLQSLTNSSFRYGVAESGIEFSGFGLFALENIPKNAILGVYTGELVHPLDDDVQYD